MYIGIIGSIGIGKSMLTEALAQRLGYRAFSEPVKENPYLDDFYRDMKRWACVMQFFMLTQRFKQHQEIQKLQTEGVHVVQDQIIFGDIQYAKLTHDLGFMDDRDYANYASHFATLEPLLTLPDVVILLETSIENTMARIQQRGRVSEQSIGKDYLASLTQLFSDWADTVNDKTHVLRLDWSSFQPVDSVVKTIENMLHVQLPLPEPLSSPAPA
ncbi:MAG: deoxynucleoside kinase [Candidatus Kerfeldbacteria bacterium]|nr:deoxynucleoside kinase [Candidatus Kerfeldbacteria bacterium]